MSQGQQHNLDGRVERNFAAPEFRKYQKPAIKEIVKGFEDSDNDVVILKAPTGAGKSLIIDGSAQTLGKSFICTPLNALVDQLDDDEFIGDSILTLKGRNNYDCIHPEDKGTPVNEAICQRQSDFECNVKGKCPYYGRKAKAEQYQKFVTNASYLMAESMIPGHVQGKLQDREYLFVDEVQKIEDFAMSFISFTISQRNVPEPVWENIEIPDENKENDWEYLLEWLRKEVLEAAHQYQNYLDGVPTMSKDETKEAEKLQQFILRVNNFLKDVEENDWVAQVETQMKKNAPDEEKIVFEPVTIGRFLESLLWSRGEKIVLSSATIPGGDWLDEIGLGDKKVKKIRLPSTFPVENRPVDMNHMVGKMSYNERDETLPKVAQKIKQIADHHEGENGFVHCRSYGIAKDIRRSLVNNGHYQWVKDNVMIQDKYDREGSLEEWLESDKQVFLSVAMDEGISLDGDKARWQVLAKVLYKSMANKRVKYRMTYRQWCKKCGKATVEWSDYGPSECAHCGNSKVSGEWDWYNRAAAIQITQAYGRGVRSKDDECVFYILDESAKKLIKWNAELFPKWFLSAIDGIDVDPERGT